MRKKFRVWDLHEKKFYYSGKGYQGHYVLSLDGNFTNLQNGAGGSEVIVQQFTGLFDRDNKEIYEGDIVEFDDSDYNIKSIKGVAEVIYCTDLTVLECPSFCLWFEKPQSGLYPSMNGSLKVIGNIFENRASEKKDSEEKEAWKKMFDLQTKLVVGLELEKIKLEKEIKNLTKDLELYKDIVRLSDHLNKKSNKQ